MSCVPNFLVNVYVLKTVEIQRSIVLSYITLCTKDIRCMTIGLEDMGPMIISKLYNKN